MSQYPISYYNPWKFLWFSIFLPYFKLNQIHPCLIYTFPVICIILVGNKCSHTYVLKKHKRQIIIGLVNFIALKSHIEYSDFHRRATPSLRRHAMPTMPHGSKSVLPIQVDLIISTLNRLLLPLPLPVHRFYLIDIFFCWFSSFFH